MTFEDIRKRLIDNDALFNNIYIVEQSFDILPNNHSHFGAAISYQDISELRKDFLDQLIDTVVDWVYSSEKYDDLKKVLFLPEKVRPQQFHRSLEKQNKNFVEEMTLCLFRGNLENCCYSILSNI